jgi:hypothetical protein
MKLYSMGVHDHSQALCIRKTAAKFSFFPIATPLTLAVVKLIILILVQCRNSRRKAALEDMMGQICAGKNGL